MWTDATVVQTNQIIGATGIVGQASADDVLKETSRSLSLGLMLLSSKLERAAQDFAAEAGIGRQIEASEMPRASGSI